MHAAWAAVRTAHSLEIASRTLQFRPVSPETGQLVSQPVLVLLLQSHKGNHKLPQLVIQGTALATAINLRLESGFRGLASSSPVPIPGSQSGSLFDG